MPSTNWHRAIKVEKSKYSPTLLAYKKAIQDRKSYVEKLSKKVLTKDEILARLLSR